MQMLSRWAGSGVKAWRVKRWPRGAWEMGESSGAQICTPELHASITWQAYQVAGSHPLLIR